MTTGTWSPVPAGLSYAWERCNANGRVCAAIAHANREPTTRSTSADLGHALLAIVQADERRHDPERLQHRDPGRRRRLGAGAGADDRPGGAGLRDRGPGALGRRPASGRASAGRLRLQAGTAATPTAAACALIPGATTSNYTTVTEGRRRHDRAHAAASDSTGRRSPTRASSARSPPPSAPLTPTTPPTISGTARVGGDTDASTTGSGRRSRAASPTSWLRCNRNGRLCAADRRCDRPALQAGRRRHGATHSSSEVVATAAGHGQAGRCQRDATDPIT